MWTPDFTYKIRVEKVIVGYPLGSDPFETMRVMPYYADVEAKVYHNATFELTIYFMRGHTSR